MIRAFFYLWRKIFMEKESFKVLVEQAAKKAFGNENEYLKLLGVMGRNTEYMIENQLMIYMRNPNMSKALATGNPLIKEKMKVDIAVKKLQMLKSNFNSTKYALEDDIKTKLPNKIQQLEKSIDNLKLDIATVPKQFDPNKKFEKMTVLGQTITDRKLAAEKLMYAIKESGSMLVPIKIANYRNFDIYSEYNVVKNTHVFMQ